jgi:hypothetical protein
MSSVKWILYHFVCSVCGKWVELIQAVEWRALFAMGSANDGSFIEIWCQDCIYLKNGQYSATVLRMSMVYMCACCLCAGVVCTVVKVVPFLFWLLLLLQCVLHLQSDYFIQMSLLSFVSGFYFKNFLSLALSSHDLKMEVLWDVTLHQLVTIH